MCVHGDFVPKGAPPPRGSPVGTVRGVPDERAAAIVRGACSVSTTIDACVDAATERAGHAPKGTARFDFSIGPEGDAVATKSGGFALDAELGDCIASALGKATYSKEAVGSARFELEFRSALVLKMVEKGTSVDGMRPELAKRVLRENFAGLRGCYEALMKRSGPRDGWVLFAINLRKDGAVSALNVDSSASFNDKPTLTCMANVIKPLTFETDGKPAYVEYTLEFANYDE